MTSGPILRSFLDDIPDYVPGQHAAPGAQLYKLSSNEMPSMPLPAVVEAVRRASTQLNRYPDIDASRLTGALAERLHVPVSNVVPSAGSGPLLTALLRASCSDGDEVVHPWPSFMAYPTVIQASGARGVPVRLTDQLRLDIAGMAAALGDRTRVVVVCNPNNPTGSVIPGGELREFIDDIPPDVVVLLDEAYCDFVRDPEFVDGLELYRDRENVMVTRTFSKTYGLAGVRVGYAVTSDGIAAGLRKVLPAFGVSVVAEEAALAALEHQADALARVDEVIVERSRMVRALRAQGWNVAESHGNFCWLPTGSESAQFATVCLEAGVLVRPFANEGVRVSIGGRAADDAFLEVAAQWRARVGTP